MKASAVAWFALAVLGVAADKGSRNVGAFVAPMQQQQVRHRRPCSSTSVVDCNEQSQLHALPHVEAPVSDIDTIESIGDDRNFHLLSLQFTPLEASKGGYSKTTANVWKWKDSVLGDGRDYFVPRPQTLKKLGQVLTQNVPQVKECVILSNCARFELLLATTTTTPSSTLKDEQQQLRLDVSRQLVAQSRYCQEQVLGAGATKYMLAGLLSMDRPNVITSTLQCDDRDEDEALEMESHWTHLTDTREILHHLARVASGMALRPRRPRRPVVFRPFSSRDAHVLLQLKRTVDVFGSGSSETRLLLQFALQAGKAARDPQKVPELRQLQPYGTGDTQKYSTEPPAELLHNVTLAMVETVIEPLVEECLAKLVAQQQASGIANFRAQCQALAQTKEEQQWINRELHAPTLELRKGNHHKKNDGVAAEGPTVDELVDRLHIRLEEKREHKQSQNICDEHR